MDAKVTATNLYGTSPESAVGSGTFIYLVPDAPILLESNTAVTAATVIGLSWSPGANGNSAIVDYAVWGR